MDSDLPTCYPVWYIQFLGILLKSQEMDTFRSSGGKGVTSPSQTCRRSTFWIDFRLRGLLSRFRLESADGGETLFAEFGSFEFECEMLSQLSQTYKFQVDMIWFLSWYHYIYRCEYGVFIVLESILRIRYTSTSWAVQDRYPSESSQSDLRFELIYSGKLMAFHPIIQNHHAAHRSSTADRWMGSKPTPWNCEEKTCGSWQTYESATINRS